MASSTRKTRHIDSRFYAVASTVLGWVGAIMTFVFVLEVIALAATGISFLTSLTAQGYVLFGYGVTGLSLAIYTVVVAVRHAKDHSRTAPERSTLSLPYISAVFWPFIPLANLLMGLVRFYRAKRRVA